MTPKNSPRATGRGWAYIGAVLGGAVSISANVAHSYLVNPHPPVLAVIIAVFWPASLFVCVEMLARVAWKSYGQRIGLVRWGVAPVALVAAVVSYRHLSGLLAYYGEDALTVAVGPIAVDGLMMVATGALIITARRRAAVQDDAIPAAPTAATPATATPFRPVYTPDTATLNAASAPAATTPVILEPAGRELEPVEAVEDASGDRYILGVHIPPAPATGRPVVETRRLAEALRSAGATTQQQIADYLGMSRRSLRDALAATAEPERPARPTLATPAKMAA